MLVMSAVGCIDTMPVTGKFLAFLQADEGRGPREDFEKASTRPPSSQSGINSDLASHVKCLLLNHLAVSAAMTVKLQIMLEQSMQTR